MEDSPTFTAFAGERLVSAGSEIEVALAVKAALDANPALQILAFNNRSGRQVDFDLRGSDEEIAARLTSASDDPEAAKRGTGRPKLGVVSREITLLPRHWEWLADQPGGASATIRKLVDRARSADAGSVRQAQQAADRFMATTLGNQPGYEDAARALYAGNRAMFLTLSEGWPPALRDHARQLAEPAFKASDVT